MLALAPAASPASPLALPAPPVDSPVDSPASSAEAAPDLIDRIAALRQARDAIDDDIRLHERVRSVVEERLAEAYKHRAVLDVEIRRLRAEHGRGVG